AATGFRISTMWCSAAALCRCRCSNRSWRRGLPKADRMIDRRGFCLMSAAGLALAVAPARARASADAELHAFFEAVYQRDLARSPIRQSRRGIRTAQDRWDDISEARRLEDARLVREDLVALRRFDPAALSPQARLSWRL